MGYSWVQFSTYVHTSELIICPTIDDDKLWLTFVFWHLFLTKSLTFLLTDVFLFTVLLLETEEKSHWYIIIGRFILEEKQFSSREDWSN